MNPLRLIVDPIREPPGYWAANQLHPGEMCLAYCLALAVNIVWARNWLVRHFDRLAGRVWDSTTMRSHGLQVRDRIAEWKNKHRATSFLDALLDVGIDQMPGFITQIKRYLSPSFELRVALRERAKRVDSLQELWANYRAASSPEATGDRLETDVMQIIGKYDQGSIDMEGSAKSLRELSHAIQRFSGTEVLSLSVPPIPSTPYLGYARSLTIDRSGGNVCISRTGDEIVIRGAPEKLAILARNIELLAEQPSRGDSHQDHLHIEYHPDHSCLKEGSVPLVVTRRTTGSGTDGGLSLRSRGR